MHCSTLRSLFLIYTTASLTAAAPIDFSALAVDKLNDAQFRESHQRDATATRAFDTISVQLKDCDNSSNQKFDIITAGKHNDKPGTMLIVSALVSTSFPKFLILLDTDIV